MSGGDSLIQCDENGQPYIEMENEEDIREMFGGDDLPFLEDDPNYKDSMETKDFVESVLIKWHHQGYFQPHGITEDGRIGWELTPWGKEHIRDIVRVKNEK